MADAVPASGWIVSGILHRLIYNICEGLEVNLNEMGTGERLGHLGPSAKYLV